MSDHEACLNTDREIWRGHADANGDTAYADSIFVTASGGIGLNCGGTTIVMPVRQWHALAALSTSVRKDAVLHKSLPQKEN